ncbi:hypothetical protein Tel_07430 [Candidatus Tenderia electrophaga]|jgi:cbb3-type cytochrome oxidase subunit 3|uniref:Cytochrome C oxidase Cbb3 n=1 Tax=Candidatus Tenderia electrophaga TaxID=1748243 RepID=A0A0S2TCX4_9GAMM|nr:hypothetical protein Tel_07430 [Candidatus Tenderia electrophaga]
MISDYLHTDWAAMTATDWWGLFVTVAIFFCMIGLYYLVFKPSSKTKLEQHRDFVLREDSEHWEK